MGDSVRVQFLMLDIYLSMQPATQANSTFYAPKLSTTKWNRICNFIMC